MGKRRGDDEIEDVQGGNGLRGVALWRTVPTNTQHFKSRVTEQLPPPSSPRLLTSPPLRGLVMLSMSTYSIRL